jgi:aspartate/methionine/tyrosine aminotransferase
VPRARHLLVSDECYLECGWEAEPVSVLHPSSAAARHEGILAVHSLSKRSNLAGYRCGFVAGDPALVGELLAVRKNLGLIVPGAGAGAMVAALDDDAHVASSTRATPPGGRCCGRAGGGRASGSTTPRPALYLWATRDEDCWETVAGSPTSGILVAPGDVLRPAGKQHVRVALTATDERVDATCARSSRIARLPELYAG